MAKDLFTFTWSVYFKSLSWAIFSGIYPESLVYPVYGRVLLTYVALEEQIFIKWFRPVLMIIDKWRVEEIFNSVIISLSPLKGSLRGY